MSLVIRHSSWTAFLHTHIRVRLWFELLHLVPHTHTCTHREGGGLCRWRLGSWKVWLIGSCRGPAMQACQHTEKGLYGHEAPCNNCLICSPCCFIINIAAAGLHCTSVRHLSVFDCPFHTGAEGIQTGTRRIQTQGKSFFKLSASAMVTVANVRLTCRCEGDLLKVMAAALLFPSAWLKPRFKFE